MESVVNPLVIIEVKGFKHLDKPIHISLVQAPLFKGA